MSRTSIRRRPARWFFPLLFAAVSPLGAQTTANWNKPGSANWNAPDSWFPAPFGDTSTWTFTISNGGTAVLNNATGTAKQVNVGNGNSGSLQIENGGSLTTGTLFLDTAASGGGTITVTGANSVLSVTSSDSYSNIGTNGSATLKILDGGLVTGGYFSVGTEETSTAEVLISGSGSKWDLTTDPNAAYPAIGKKGKGTVTVSDGGTLASNFYLYLGVEAGSEGTLKIGDGSTAGSILVPNIYGGDGAAEVIFSQTDSSYTLGASLSGSLKVTQSAPGTTILRGLNTYTGGTTITSGTLQIGDGGIGGTAGTGGVVNNGVLVLNSLGPTGSPTFSNLISGTGQLVQQSTGATLLLGDNTYTGGTTIASGTLQIGDGGTAGALGSGAVVNNSVLAFNRSDSITVASAISGTGQLRMIGNGTLTLTGSSSYDGGDRARSDTLVKSGTLAVSGSGASLNHTGRMVVGDTDGDNGSLVIANGGTVTSGIDRIAQQAGSVGSVTVAGGAWVNGSVEIGNFGTGTLTISDGLVSSTGIVLGVNNGATGTVTITGGALTVSDILTIGSLGSGTLTVDGGLVTSDNATLGYANTGRGSVTVTSGTLAVAKQFIVGSNGTTNELLVQGGLVSSGTGIVGYGNSDSGTVTVTSGTWANTGQLVVGGLGTGTLNLAGDGVVSSGTGTLWLGSNLYSVGTLNIGGGTLLAEAVRGGAGTAVVNFNPTGETVFSPQLTGTLSVNKLGGGTGILTGNNNYTGPTTIGAGTLQVGDGGTTGTLGSAAIANNGTLAVNRSDSFTFANTIGGTGRFVQAGSGTTLLTAINGYTGATDILAGTLRVNGALTGSPVVTVHNGGTLGGSGTIGGAVEVLGGGALAAGNSPGTLTVGSLKLNSGAISNFELGHSSDLVAVTGDLTVGGILNLSDSGGFENTSYTLFTYGGALTNHYFELNLIPTGWNRANFLVDLSTSGEVRLTVDNTATIQYWDGGETSPDGSISGGSGTWSHAGTHWTNGNGSLNADWQGVVGVFGGTAGTVSMVDDVAFSQLQFETGGYKLADGGGSLAVSGTSPELWTAADAGAEIAAPIGGTGVLRKTGAGGLTLSGSNSYSGGTVIANGTVRTENANALGSGSVTLQSLGALDVAKELTIGGDFTWNGGVIHQSLGEMTTTIHVTGALDNSGGGHEFSISTGTGFAFNTAYTLLTFSDGSAFLPDGLVANSLDGIAPGFRLFNTGNALQIIYIGALTGPILQNSGAIHTPVDQTFVVDGAVRTGTDAESNEALSLIFAGGGGSLTVHNTLKLGSGAITTGTGNAVILDGTLTSDSGYQIDTDGDLSILSVLSGGGSGGLIKSGPGTLQLSGSNTYTGGTVIGAGTVRTQNARALGSGAVSLNAGATLAPVGTLEIAGFTWNGGTLSYSQGGVDRIDVAGDFTKGSGGEPFVFSLAGAGFDINETYTLLTFGGNDGFDLSDFSAPAFYGITPVFAFDGNALTVHYTGATSGPVLQNSGPAFTPVDANFLVSGPVTTRGPVENNTVNSLLFEGNSSLEVSNTLAVTSGNVTVMDGGAALTGDAVSTPGGFRKLGGGTLLAGASITAGGAAAIEEGGLIVNGRFAAANGLTVFPNTFLGGSGVIDGHVVNRGVLTPGNSPGTLTIAGDYTQAGHGAFVLEIAGKNDFDRLLVRGVAALSGRLDVIPYDGYRLDYGQKFTFLKAGRVTGAFDAVRLPAGLRSRILTKENAATLVVAPESYTEVAQTSGQKAVAKALDRYIPARKGDRQNVSIALDELGAAEYPGAFNQIAPNLYQSLADLTIEQSNAQGQMLQQRFGAVRLGSRGFTQMGIEAPVVTDSRGQRDTGKGIKEVADIMAPAADNPWGVWIQGNGLFAKNSGLDAVPNFRHDSGGFLLGADYRWSDAVATGAYAGYQNTEVRYDGGSHTGVNAARFGAYATLDTGNGFYGNAVLGGGSSDYRVRRSIDFGSLGRTARSNPHGAEFSAMLGGGYDWKAGNFTFGPVASGQYTYVNLNGFTETGARSLDLKIDDQEAHSLRSTLGGRVAYCWPLGGEMALIPEGRVAWQHEFMQDSRNIGARLDGGAGPGFDAATATPQRDALFAGVGLNLQAGDRWNANLYFNSDLSRGDFESQMVSGGVNIRF